ncbi:MAG: phage terminase large subunit [Clostridiales bacterium]|nr:phage terminase large subunit [Clostridiales bacterium]
MADKLGITLDFHPSEKQKQFMNSRAKYTAYGGARGGGKSYALRYKLVFMCLKYPGIRALLIRRTYPELRENHIRPLMQILCVKNRKLAEWCERDKCFDFINGSHLKLGYLCDDGDLLGYQGQEFDVIAVDEATQIDEHAFAVLTASLRGANSFPKRMYLTCNPGGIGHGWVKRLFIDKDYRGAERADEYAFIPAGVYDNDALMREDPEYVRQIENLPTDLRRAWLDGCWDIFSGQFFPEFDAEKHVERAFTPDSSYQKYLAVDYGLDMLAAEFVALDSGGHAHVYDEIYESGLIVSEAAALIRKKLCDGMICIAPADLWSRQKDSGLSIAELFMQNGVFFQKLTPSRIGGFAAMKEWLKVGDDGKPKMTICDNCKNIIRTLPLLIYDEKNPCDAATEPHEITHAPDALRYFCSARPVFSEKAPHKRLSLRKEVL